MTENDLALALKEISKAVTDHRYELGRDIAVLTTNVETLQASHETNAEKLDEVLRLELSCPARADNAGVNARIKQLEVSDRVRIETDLQVARDEATGQQDVQRRAAGEGRFSETPSGRFLKSVAPYLWKGVLIFGLAFGASVVARFSSSDADQKPTLNAIQAIADAVARTSIEVDKVKRTVDATEENVEEDATAASAAAPPINIEVSR
jgi:uncharacterized coiled-coil protein SlyX